MVCGTTGENATLSGDEHQELVRVTLRENAGRMKVIVGIGAPSKEQVQMMLEKTLQVKLESRHLDATDALAIALCHFYETSSPLRAAKGKGGWEQFIKDHPDRIS